MTKKPPKSSKNKIKDRLDKAQPVTLEVIEGGKTSGGGKQGGDAGGNDFPPPIDQDAPPRLTPEQWKIVERSKDYDENDTDNGKRLLDWSGDQVKHVDQIGWHAWAGSHWDEESGEHAVRRCAQGLVGRIKREAALIVASKDEQALIEAGEKLQADHPEVRKRDEATKAAIKLGTDIAKDVAGRRGGRYKFAVQSGNLPRTMAMISQAEPFQSVKPGALDPENFALNCKNGTLRFKRVRDDECPDPDTVRWKVEQSFSPHQPADMISKVTACDWNPDAPETVWRKDLARYMPDPKKREYLQVAMGYTAMGISGEQVFHYLYGDGQNWKSAFQESTGRALGSYRKAMGFGSISGDQMPDGSKPSPDWAGLSSRRMVTIEEVPRVAPLKEEQIKVITSASPFPVRLLHKNFFDLMPKFVMWMCSNSEPNIKGGDLGIWRRTRVMRWDEKVPDEGKLPFDQVMALYEPCQEDILNWIVEGVHKYLIEGLDTYVTDDMRLYVANLRRDRDSVGAFAGDCLVHREGNNVRARSMYEAFKAWCGANGVDPVLSETAFGRQIKRVTVGEKTMEKRKGKSPEGKFYGDLIMKDVPRDDPPHGGDRYDF
jgi:putative DNA primase/helicase